MESVEHDERVMTLLDSALDLPAAERAAWLRAGANSPEVVAEVLDRAAWEERMGGFLRSSLVELAISESAVPAGRRIGHYLVHEELGRGGMGVVYRAVDENLGRTVALKVLSAAAGSALDRRRFLREAKSASTLNHPNIVAIHEFDSDSGQDFIAMEYIEGKTLDQAVAPKRDFRVLLGYARQIAVALARAHSAGIVHRDLKPGNIMVTREGEIKVLDFGLAKHERAAMLSSESGETMTTDALSHAGSLIGTPAYMSPEQVTGEAIDARSDVFSFGVILYEMVAGERPFRGGNAAALLVQIAGKPHPPVQGLNPEVPPRLARLIDRCLAKKPEERLPSMEVAASELSSILAGLEKPPARRLFLAWIAAAALAIAGAGAWLWQRPAPPVAHTVRYSLLNEQGIAVPTNAPFRGGATVRLRIQASSDGFLYLVNNGAYDDGRAQLYVLLPRPGTSAAVGANEKRLTEGLVFDQNPGVEQMSVVWSAKPVRLLEEAVNGPLRGEVRDPNQVRGIQQFLGKLQLEGKTTQAASGNEVLVEGAGDVVGSLIELRHR